MTFQRTRLIHLRCLGGYGPSVCHHGKLSTAAADILVAASLIDSLETGTLLWKSPAHFEEMMNLQRHPKNTQVRIT